MPGEWDDAMMSPNALQIDETSKPWDACIPNVATAVMAAPSIARQGHTV